jgi:hypothetical protein
MKAAPLLGGGGGQGVVGMESGAPVNHPYPLLIKEGNPHC